MLTIRVGTKIYELSEASAEDLGRRIPRPAPEGGEPVAGSLEAKLRDAVQRRQPAELERGELAILGATIEAWATEIAVDAADVQALRHAIAEHLTMS